MSKRESDPRAEMVRAAIAKALRVADLMPGERIGVDVVINYEDCSMSFDWEARTFRTHDEEGNTVIIKFNHGADDVGELAGLFGDMAREMAFREDGVRSEGEYEGKRVLDEAAADKLQLKMRPQEALDELKAEYEGKSREELSRKPACS